MKVRAATLACLLALQSACVTTMNPIAGPQAATGPAQAGEQRIAISRGDRLRVLTRDGRRRMVTIVDANENALVTQRETIPIADLVFVERQEFSGGGTAAALGGVLIILVLAAGAAPVAISMPPM